MDINNKELSEEERLEIERREKEMMKKFEKIKKSWSKR